MISWMKSDKAHYYGHRGELYIDTADLGGHDLLRLQGSDLTGFIFDLAHTKVNLLLHSADVDLIIDHAAAYARQNAKPLSSDPRACWEGNILWINPGWLDGRLFKIADGKWSIEAAPARLFAPLPPSMAMPIPTDGMAGTDLPKLIEKGIKGFGAFHAFFCTLLATMMMPMDSVHPIIIITGEGAKGKTTTMKLIMQLVDPEQGNECMIVSEDQRNILVTCIRRKTLGLDNTSRLPISDDLLSQMYAGGMYNERKMYTNNELSQTRIERMRVIINGVSPDFSKSDFFTKAIFLEQPEVKVKGKEGEDEFEGLNAVEADWLNLLPQALGSLLSVIAEGLPHYQAWEQRRRSEGRRPTASVRFVEFAVMGESFACAMGFPADEFTKQVKALDDTSKDTAVISDECTQLVIEWANGKRGSSFELAGEDDLFSGSSYPKADRYEISTTNLHAELRALAKSGGYNLYKMSWLNSPAAFGKHLRKSLQNINNTDWSIIQKARNGAGWDIVKKN